MAKKLPMKIDADDYHEFPRMQALLNQFIPGIKLKEVCCCSEYGEYLGIVYRGKLTDKKNAELFNKLKKECQENDR